MTEYISTKDTATLVRQALRAAFPGIKFSVRCDRGTAAAWIGIHWIDGPTTRQVTETVGRFEGRKFNGMTDSYDEQGSTLIAREDGQLPVEVRYTCDGITTNRRFSPAAFLHAQDLISTSCRSHRVPDVRVCDENGAPLCNVTPPAEIFCQRRLNTDPLVPS